VPTQALGRLQLLDVFCLEWRDHSGPLAHGSERLLALLALSPEGLRRRQVARLLWPDLPTERAPASLRTLMWRFRQQCPGLLVTDGELLRVRDGMDVDVRRLQDLAARWGSQQAGGELVRHPAALGELDALVAPTTLLPGWYDDWVLFHRERVSAMRIELLTLAARAMLEAGAHLRALDLALAAVASEPLDEDLHVLVAQIHLAQGNPSEALRQYELCSSVLRRELGIEPTRQFTDLMPLRHAAPRADPAVAAGGPAPKRRAAHGRARR
jgi:DNA-binding SARP family transcriptional activator